MSLHSKIFSSILVLLQAVSPATPVVSAPSSTKPTVEPAQTYERTHRPLKKRPPVAPVTPSAKPAPVQSASLFVPPVPPALPVYNDQHYAQKLDEMGVLNSPTYVNDDTHCKSLAYRTIDALPAAHTSTLYELRLSFDPNIRRGLSNSHMMTMRCVNVNDPVFTAVMVHEVGHLVDTGLLSGTPHAGRSPFHDFGKPIYNNDPSLAFYNISWKDNTTLHKETSYRDFLSSYGRTDPFEDFSEAYIWYVLQSENFRRLAENTPALQAKYDFMRDRVFEGKEFSGKYTYFDHYKRVYDSTLLLYPLYTFWNNQLF
jgi:hypothetical protein